MFKIIKLNNSLTIHFHVRIESIVGSWLRGYPLLVLDGSLLYKNHMERPQQSLQEKELK